ncbi:MAG: hypothetical protein HN742_38205 [Lentisphaerae bacterium]|jgi:hypothetical protein|nr:hypothetical protein [Lentisphaerota bacterium]MBT4820196.1 hypothetical protein [Lentisphaerota bacterium]MBT5608424.1 hypothetical protein [Lentisphaerota bacterium]MBT7055042.1 hypothetical protein [Lentisphaerota bacterium]MBT7847762.1 hypothetical protein [Lentisphaerota bacterium]
MASYVLRLRDLSKPPKEAWGLLVSVESVEEALRIAKEKARDRADCCAFEITDPAADELLAAGLVKDIPDGTSD